MLTTIDNPFDPFDQFDEWFAYDELVGHHTCAYLARVTLYSPDQADSAQSEAIDSAITEIIANNPLGIYRRVTKKDHRTKQVKANGSDLFVDDLTTIPA